MMVPHGNYLSLAAKPDQLRILPEPRRSASGSDAGGVGPNGRMRQWAWRPLCLRYFRK
jgi:hypothetical protein